MQSCSQKVSKSLLLNLFISYLPKAKWELIFIVYSRSDQGNSIVKESDKWSLSIAIINNEVYLLLLLINFIMRITSYINLTD